MNSLCRNDTNRSFANLFMTLRTVLERSSRALVLTTLSIFFWIGLSACTVPPRQIAVTSEPSMAAVVVVGQPDKRCVTPCSLTVVGDTYALLGVKDGYASQTYQAKPSTFWDRTWIEDPTLRYVAGFTALGGLAVYLHVHPDAVAWVVGGTLVGGLAPSPRDEALHIVFKTTPSTD